MRTCHIVSVSYCLAAMVLLVSAQNINIGQIQSSEIDSRFDPRVSDVLARNILQLSQEIGTTILQDSDQPTEVFSPLSIYTALSVLMMGANGQTFQELLSLLKINNDAYLSQNTWKVHEELSLMINDLSLERQHPARRRAQAPWTTQRVRMHRNHNETYSQQQISVANGIFFQNGYSIRPEYRTAIESVYNATLQRLDFANKPEISTKYINSWVSEKTQGKINEIIKEPLPASTKAIMSNALYFKAFWERGFMEGGTRPLNFYPDGFDRPAITVDMMAAGGSYPFYDSKEYDCRIIGLPYRNRLSTMYIIMPNNSTRHRLRQFQATLTANKINEMIERMEWKTSILLFPKLHITNRVDLRKILNRMGLRSLFNYEQSDLSLISTGVETLNDLNVQQVSNPVNDGETKQFLFSRLGQVNETNSAPLHTVRRGKRSSVTYKAVSSDFHAQREPLRLKDLVIGKRITKSYPFKKLRSRGRRSILDDSTINLKRLDALRTRITEYRYTNPRLYADELIHQVDLTVNEVGTEGGAATITTLRRSGPDVLFRAETPFLFLIRQEDTKFPIFYGAVFEPRNN